MNKSEQITAMLTAKSNHIATVDEIAGELGFTKAAVIGAVGNLVKAGMVKSEDGSIELIKVNSMAAELVEEHKEEVKEEIAGGSMSATAVGEVNEESKEDVKEELAGDKGEQPKTEQPKTEEVNAAPAAPKPLSKAARAEAIFVTMTAEGAPRKDIIKAFIDQVGLTDSGAATYLQNIKKKLGLVNQK